MNHRTTFRAAILLACAASLLLAQPAGQAPPAQQPAQPATVAQPEPTSPVAKQPAVKTKEEADAVTAMLNAVQGADSDARIKVCEDLLQKFPDSEFRPLALFFLTASYQEKNDYEKTIAYGELTLKADPGNFQTSLMLARLIASRTRENDLDKEEKLTAAEKYTGQALEVLKTAPRPNPSVTDQQWAEAKNEMMAQAYESYAMISLARNKNDAAIEQFRKAIDTAPPGDPATMVRLGNALSKVGKYDEAISTFEKVMAMADAVPQVKQIAQAERARAVQAKSQGAKPPTQ